MKAITQKWFDGEVLEKINLRNKRSKKFKKSRLHIDKKWKYDALKPKTNWVKKKKKRKKKQAFFKDRLSKTIDKPKELWESLKPLSMPNKTVTSMQLKKMII